MARRCCKHQLRRVDDLSGIWDFAFLGETDPDRIDVGNVVYDACMAVPGCFDATPAYAGKRGLAAYRRKVRLDRAGDFRLEIDGAHHWCRTLLDGRVLGEHSGGFTRFCHDFTVTAAGNYDLVILVDNRFDEDRSPLHLEYFDWYHFGGLTRPVRIHELLPVFLDRVELSTIHLDGPSFEVVCHYRARSAASVTLELSLDGQVLSRERVEVEPPSGQLCRSLRAPGCRRWSPASPVLHQLRVRLGEDDRCQRVGFRTVECRDRRLWLNGEPLVLRGVNRHEAHPQFGHAVPRQQQLADLQLIKRLGANFLRGSHYPQDPALLDLCDELGLLVFSEAIGWQQRKEHLHSAQYMAAQLAHIDEMLDMSFNHPSVVIWGVLNEAESSDPSCQPSYQRLVSHIKQRDPSRPVTYATCRHFNDACSECADLISINAYPGWYTGSLHEIPERLDEIIAYFRELEPDKPILISEIGGGAIYGCHDQPAQRWTEEYQAELLRRVIRHLLAAQTDCVGVCLWQFCDTRTTEDLGMAMGRPRGYNNKGILDEYRRPKLAYAVVREEYTRSIEPG